jgi:hypothetical protein
MVMASDGSPSGEENKFDWSPIVKLPSSPAFSKSAACRHGYRFYSINIYKHARSGQTIA